MEVIKNVETSLDHMNVYADLDIKKTQGFAQVKHVCRKFVNFFN